MVEYEEAKDMIHCSILSLPEFPPEWANRKDVFRLAVPSAYIQTSKTETQEWGVMLLLADKHYLAYRLLLSTSYGYGG